MNNIKKIFFLSSISIILSVNLCSDVNININTQKEYYNKFLSCISVTDNCNLNVKCDMCGIEYNHPGKKQLKDNLNEYDISYFKEGNSITLSKTIFLNKLYWLYTIQKDYDGSSYDIINDLKLFIDTHSKHLNKKNIIKLYSKKDFYVYKIPNIVSNYKKISGKKEFVILDCNQYGWCYVPEYDGYIRKHKYIEVTHKEKKAILPKQTLQETKKLLNKNSNSINDLLKNVVKTKEKIEHLDTHRVFLQSDKNLNLNQKEDENVSEKSEIINNINLNSSSMYLYSKKDYIIYTKPFENNDIKYGVGPKTIVVDSCDQYGWCHISEDDGYIKKHQYIEVDNIDTKTVIDTPIKNLLKVSEKTVLKEDINTTKKIVNISLKENKSTISNKYWIKNPKLISWHDQEKDRIYVKYSTNLVDHERNIKLEWINPLGEISRTRDMKIKKYHRSFYDYRYYTGRLQGNWTVNIIDEDGTKTNIDFNIVY